jgi:hypothetical protein
MQSHQTLEASMSEFVRARLIAHGVLKLADVADNTLRIALERGER